MIKAKPKLNGRAKLNGHAKQPDPPLAPVSDGAKPADPKPAGRDDGGRFAAGNKFARGNPFSRRLGEMRSALLKSATPEKVQALGDKLHELALGGDLQAAQLWLTYCVGKPVAAVDPDRLDLEEFALLDERPTPAQVYRAACYGLHPVWATTFTKILAAHAGEDMGPEESAKARKVFCPQSEREQDFINTQITELLLARARGK